MTTIVANPHVGDVGTGLQFQCIDQDGKVIDVSGATTKQIIFWKPDYSSFTVTAVLITDGKDGWIQYVTQSTSDLDIAGLWRAQVYIVLGGGTSWHSDTNNFRVSSNPDGVGYGLAN